MDNNSILEHFKQYRKQYDMSITATLTTDGVLVNGNVQSQAGPVTMTNDAFHCTGIYPTAIDVNGVRLVPSAAYDQILISIADANSGYTYTNGSVDLMAFYERGQNFQWPGWWFYPMQQLNIGFTWNTLGGTSTTAQPILVTLDLFGYRIAASDYPQVVAGIRQMAGLN